jgi:hypothetical protein
MSDAENQSEDHGPGQWIACRQKDGQGTFLPLPLDWSTRSADELPTEEKLAEVATTVRAEVALPGGAPGEVEGFLTGDGDLYVWVPLEIVESLRVLPLG